MIRVAIQGAAGRMGHALIQSCLGAEQLQLAAALERPGNPAVGADAGVVAGLPNLGVTVTDDLATVIDGLYVLFDFTRPAPALAAFALSPPPCPPLVLPTNIRLAPLRTPSH